MAQLGKYSELNNQYSVVHLHTSFFYQGHLGNDLKFSFKVKIQHNLLLGMR